MQQDKPKTKSTRSNSRKADVIIHYAAEQAVADGVLHDVPPQLSQACGFRLPVRVTCGVSDLLGPMTDAERFMDALEGVLMKAQEAIRRSKQGEQLVEFSFKVNGQNETLWAALDGTSGVAVHIFKPEEY